MSRKYQENVNLFKKLLQEGAQINELTELFDKIILEIFVEFANQYPEIVNMFNFFLQGQDKLDSKMISQRYSIYKRGQNGKSRKFMMDKTYWLTMIGLVRLFTPITKESIFWDQFMTKYYTESDFNTVLIVFCVYMGIDVTEPSNGKFIQDLFGGLIPILIEWLNNPNDTKKFKNEIESLITRIPLTNNKQEWKDMTLEGYFMNDESFADLFSIYASSFWSALNSNLNEAVEFLLKFVQDNLKQIKAAKRVLQGIEDNYDHVETFAARVEEYGEQVKQIEHKTKLYTKLVDENSKINMLSSINDEVDNFRMKKRKLNQELNFTLRDLMKTKALLLEHRFIMYIVSQLSFFTTLIGIFMNSLTDNQIKKEQIDSQFMANLTEQSSEVIESIIEDLDEIIEQKSKVLDKIELVEKIKADFKEWHQIEKDCFEKLA